jgi:hypothetical protein
MWGLMLIVHAAVGDVEKVEGALRDGVSPNVADSGGWTPLHLAAGLGHLQVVRLLLERGADPAVRNRLGDTPLHVAIMQGRPEVARVLLERGGTRLLEIPSDWGRTPLDCLEIAKRAGAREVLAGIGVPSSAPARCSSHPRQVGPVAGPWDTACDVPPGAEAACL